MQNKGTSPAQQWERQIVKSQLVEIPIITLNSALPQYKFPTQDFLRGKYITGIETFNVVDMPNAPQSGYAVITAANMLASFLTLYEQNPEAIDAQGINASGEGQWNELIPLVTLHRVNNNSSSWVRERADFTPRVIVWEKSYVAIANGQSLGNGAAVSFVFQVYYIGNARDNN